MTRRRFFQIIPLGCVILAIFFAFLFISTPRQAMVAPATARATPGGKLAISTLSFEPRGAAAAAPVVVEPPSPAPAPTAPAATRKTEPAKPAPKPAAPALRAAAPVQTATTQTTAASVCSGAFITQFICLLNEYRASQGVAKLSYSGALASVAVTHSTWMNSTGTFSHTGANGSTFTDRCEAAGVNCYGENLADGAKSAQNLLDMWKASPSHNANLLRPFRSIGLGVAGTFTTALFQ